MDFSNLETQKYQHHQLARQRDAQDQRRSCVAQTKLNQGRVDAKKQASEGVYRQPFGCVM